MKTVTNDQSETHKYLKKHNNKMQKPVNRKNRKFSSLENIQKNTKRKQR